MSRLLMCASSHLLCYIYRLFNIQESMSIIVFDFISPSIEDYIFMRSFLTSFCWSQDCNKLSIFRLSNNYNLHIGLFNEVIQYIQYTYYKSSFSQNMDQGTRKSTTADGTLPSSAQDLVEVQKDVILILKNQVQTKEQERIKLSQNLKKLYDQNEIQIKRLKEKYETNLKDAEEELRNKEKQMLRIEEAYKRQLQSVESLLKRESKRIEQLKDLQIRHLKQIQTREIRQWQTRLGEKDEKERVLENKMKQYETEIGKLNKQVAENNGNGCTICLLKVLLAGTIFLLFLLYNSAMILGFEVTQRDQAIAYQTHAHQQQRRYTESILSQQKKYLEDKSGCSIM